MPAAALGAAIYLHLRHNNLYTTLQRELKGNNVEQKAKALAEALPAMHLPPLTDSERNSYFNVERESDSYVADHVQNRVKLRAILGTIMTVILAIVSISGGVKEVKAKNHSPKQVTVELTELSSEQDGYYGYYYVYLKYNVSVKKYGIDDMKIKTYVYDKNGNEITTVTTSFSNMNLPEDSSKTITSELKSSGLSDSFAKLYEGSLDTLEFKHEIEYIYFADGESYYREAEN